MYDFILFHFYTIATVLAKFIQRTAMCSSYSLNYILYKVFQLKKLPRVIYKIREQLFYNCKLQFIEFINAFWIIKSILTKQIM